MFAASHASISIFVSGWRTAPMPERWGLKPYGAVSGGLNVGKVENATLVEESTS
jgi:hypothetical protein